MSRKDIIAFIQNDICPQISLDKVGAVAFFSFDFKAIIRLIERWRRHHNFPQHLTAQVDNGFLFINGSPAGRITAAPQTVYPENDYYEGRILAMHEDD